MATSTGYDYGVRKALMDRGVNPADIGYDNRTGYVTVGGKNFIKPEKVYQGTSFTTEQNFNQAWDAFNKQQQQQQQYGQVQTSPVTSSPYNTAVRQTLNAYGVANNQIGYDKGSNTVTINGIPFLQPGRVTQGVSYTNPEQFNQAWRNYNMTNLQNQYMNPQLPENRYTPQIDQTLQYLMDFARNQQVTDPYSTPEYQAYAAQAARRANQGIRAAQEALGSAGFGRSTALGERAQQIQNAEEEYLTTQVIPQILAAEQQRRQQQFANVLNLLSPLMSQQGYMDNRAQMERENALQMLAYLTGEDQRAIENELQRKQANLNAALAVGEATGRLVSPQQDWSGLFRQATRSDTPLNLAGQQFQSAEDQRRFSNEMILREFNENVRQFGLEYALRQAAQDLDRQRLLLQEDDNARQWAALEASLAGAGSGGDSTGNLTANQLLQSIRSLYSVDGQLPTDEATREQMALNVIDAGLSDAQTNQVLAALGFSKSEIDRIVKKYGGNG